MSDGPFGILGPSRGYDDLALAVVSAVVIYCIVISVGSGCWKASA